MNTLFLFGGAAVVTLLVLSVILSMCFRVVVSTNDVHIVQSSKRSTVYGKDQSSGNTYYAWPAWMPFIGVKTIVLPVSNFPVKLDGYEAYDKGRLPFQVDVMAFFRIEDATLAAQRISDFGQLMQQLVGILQGACRSILATSEIETILEGRSEFGERFTKEVDHNLANWGVRTVKNIEFMDIRDSKDSKVIHNIMAKKQSFIEMESRVAVAGNKRQAELSEIEARQQVNVRAQEAEQMVGIRTAEKEQRVGIAAEISKQQIAEAAATTADKEMSVRKVNEVRQADINKEVAVVLANQAAQTVVIDAEAKKKSVVTIAEGDLEKAKREAEGVEARGKAEGAAQEAILMAPITTQINLAKEIGANPAYQEYLVRIRGLEKEQAVGIAQAEALKSADVKVIANSGEVTSGVKTVMDLFTTKGGTNLGGMIEALKQTPAGAALINKFVGGDKPAA